MAIIINTHDVRQREFLSSELEDDSICDGDFFGATGDIGPYVWKLDGSTANWFGSSQPGANQLEIKDGQSLRQAMEARYPGDFTIHRMKLLPRQYHPRIARPNHAHPYESPGYLPMVSQHSPVIASSLLQIRSLVGQLDEIFQTIHPVASNLATYGSKIRNLLVLASTECEAQWRAVLNANGYSKSGRLNTNDYVKLKAAMRLDEYAVKLIHYPWIADRSPFYGWSVSDPTASLMWFDDYNAVKHDREKSFERATLNSAVQAITAIWVMIAAQFGYHGIREFDDLARYFHLSQVPLWRFSDVYIVTGVSEAEAVPYKF